MGKSSCLSLQDVRRVVRILGELQELAPLSPEWRAHAVDGVRQLLSAQFASMPEMLGYRPGGRIRTRSVVCAGWLDRAGGEFLRQHYIREGDLPENFSRHPLMERLMAGSKRVYTYRRVELVPDAIWRRSDIAQQVRMATGLDDTVDSVYRLDCRGWIVGFGCSRAIGDRPFSERDRNLMHLMTVELGRTCRAGFQPPDYGGLKLSPRQWETLGYLLAGDSEKQIARRMDISNHTVHEYVKGIYARVGVSSRAELLARCLGPRRRSLSFETHRVRAAEQRSRAGWKRHA